MGDPTTDNYIVTGGFFDPTGPICANGKAAESATQQDAETNMLVPSEFYTHFDREEYERFGRMVPLAFSCKDSGADSGEIAPTLRSMNFAGSHANAGGQVAVAFTTEQTPKFNDDCALTLTKQSPTGGGQPQAVAFQSSQSGMREVDTHATLDSNNGSRRHNGVLVPAVGLDEEQNAVEDGMGCLKARREGGGFEGSVMTPAMQVRRLTSVECCRLQKFPDDYLSQVRINGKPPADGPMYRALGNSMAVCCMEWIGKRIQLVDFFS